MLRKRKTNLFLNGFLQIINLLLKTNYETNLWNYVLFRLFYTSTNQLFCHFQAVKTLSTWSINASKKLDIHPWLCLCVNFKDRQTTRTVFEINVLKVSSSATMVRPFWRKMCVSVSIQKLITFYADHKIYWLCTRLLSFSYRCVMCISLEIHVVYIV